MDSRCPSQSTCIYAGGVETTVAIRDNSGTIQTLDLCKGDCLSSTDSDSIRIELDGSPHLLVLKNVTPYPLSYFDSRPKEALITLALVD